MSGGSLDYVYCRVDDAADSIRSRSQDPRHLAFADHLKKVSEALHDIEWVFSGDKGAGDEVKAIMAVVSHADVIEAAVVKAREAENDLRQALANAGVPQ